MPPAPDVAQNVPQISVMTLRFFTRIVRSYFRRHFRSVMAQHAERLASASGPLIVYANHSSWWDPMISILLAQMFLPQRRHYAPMDAAALARYPILRKLGIFPVDMASPRGAAQFLRTGQAILRDGGVLWITPQGRFADPRSQPLAFKSGLAALALRVPEAKLLPLAIEYAFWNERLPEALLHVAPGFLLPTSTTVESATHYLEQQLAEAMLALKTASMARDAAAFHSLLEGGRGTGGFYAFGRRLRALFRKEQLQDDHTLRSKSHYKARR